MRSTSVSDVSRSLQSWVSTILSGCTHSWRFSIFIKYVQAGLRRGGLTPACGFAHPRYDQGCHSQTEAVSATSLPREVHQNRSWLSADKQRRIWKNTHTLASFVAVCCCCSLPESVPFPFQPLGSTCWRCRYLIVILVRTAAAAAAQLLLCTCKFNTSSSGTTVYTTNSKQVSSIKWLCIKNNVFTLSRYVYVEQKAKVRKTKRKNIYE